MPSTNKQRLKDKVEGNELDLSMCELTDLPVDEMVKLTKVTVLDLSCNLLLSLPDDFCAMRNIVKLDLSKNYLAELPADFGSLTSLEHLDLLCNKLHILPLSFAQLASLKWLDLKDNPLDENLRVAAGDCLDEKQCRKCAQNVIKFMKYANSEMERKRDIEMKKEREKEKQRKIQEERMRQQKKAEKERKRRENVERQREVMEEKKPDIPVPDIEADEMRESGDFGVEEQPEQSSTNEPSGGGRTVLLLTTGAVLLSALAGLYMFCDKHRSSPACRQLLAALHDLYAHVRRVAALAANKFNSTQ